MIKDLLGALGSWDVRLREGTPAEIVSALDYFGHIAVVRGPVDVASLGDGILPAARYVGILRERGTDDSPLIGGVGMAAWLGDEDEKGAVFESPVVIDNKSFADSIAAVLPSSVQIGFIGSIAGTYSGRHVFETPRSALSTICSAFGADWYVGGDAKLYAGTTAQLYGTTPKAVVVRRGAGTDIDLVALGGKFAVGTDVVDYSTRVVLIGQTTEQGSFATATADAPSVPYFDLFGNPVKRTRMISESGTTAGSVTARAALQINRFNRTRKALKISTEDYDIEGNFVVGEWAYVYDPDTGIFDPAREIVFRGEILHPDIVRISGIGYPISEGHTVAFRRGNGTWLDLTPWIEFESGSNEITIGDLPKSLTSASNPLLDRIDGNPVGANTGAPAVDKLKPNAPSAPSVSSSVISNDKGGIEGQASVSWTGPTTNTDGSALTDFSNFIMRYKLSTNAAWAFVNTYDTTTTVSVLPGRNYDFAVSARDVNDNVSAWSATTTALTATDNVPPPAPSDPTVSAYYGQLRIVWDGKSSTGAAMPVDFNRVEVHVGSASNFTPSAATLVDSLIVGGVSYATAPYGAARWVKLVAYDSTGNPSAPSGSVTGATTKVGSADIASLSVGQLTAGTQTVDVVIAGRNTTALTGARVEHNAGGFFAYDGNNVATVSIPVSGSPTFVGTVVGSVLSTATSGPRTEIGRASYAYGPLSSPLSYQAEEVRFFSTVSLGDAQIDPPKIRGAATPSSIADSYSLIASTGQPTYQGNTGDEATFSLTSGRPNSSASVRQSTAQITASSTISVLAPRAVLGSYQGAFVDIDSVNQSIILDPSTNAGTLSIVPHPAQPVICSPMLRFRTPNNVDAAIFVANDNRGAAFEFQNGSSTAFVSARARAFEVQSDARAKTRIARSSVNFIDKVNSAEVKKYRRKADDANTARDEIGLLAQEAPTEIVAGDTETGLTIDLYRMSAVLWGAVRELTAEVNALKGK